MKWKLNLTKPMVGLFIFPALLITVSSSLAQKTGKAFADSLIGELPAMKNDTARAKALNKISLTYIDVQLDSARKYGDMGLRLVRRMNWQRGISAFYTVYGNINAKIGNNDEQIKWYTASLSIALKTSDTANIAISYNNIGGVEYARANYVKAVEYFTKTLSLAEASGNNYMTSMALENIARAWYQNQNYPLSLQYGQRSLAVKKKGEYPDEIIPNSLTIIADNYREMKQYDSAKYYFEEALRYYDKNGDISGKASALMGYAAIFEYEGNLPNAIWYGTKAKILFDSLSADFETAVINAAHLGKYYIRLAQQSSQVEIPQTGILVKGQLLNRGIDLLKNAALVSQKKQYTDNYYQALFYLAEGYAAKGDYKNAYIIDQEAKQIEDSIYSQQNKNKLAQSIANLEIEKKNTELQLQELRIHTQQRQRLFYIAGLIALTLVGGLLFYQNKVRKKNNTTLLKLNTELDEANQIKAKFFGILSHDLRGPVANLVNYLHLQKNAPDLLDKERAVSQQQKISQSAENLLDTMETMLLWSKQQMQQFKPVVKEVPVQQLFQQIEQHFATAEHVHFKFEQLPNLKLATDENYLLAIMTNLTANAVKALHSTANATVEWKAWKEQDKTVLSISDNGPGISAEQMQHLFHSEATGNAKTGFGMHIIRDLAKAIQCNISVNQMPGGGAVFVLTA
jgi:signal transduction histidine kinase